MSIFVQMPSITLEKEEKKQPTVCCECGGDGGELRFIGNDPMTKKARYKCLKCRKGDGNRDAAKSTFPFTAEHIVPGQSIEVQSIYHLRKLEAQYGIQSSAYNDEERHWAR